MNKPETKDFIQVGDYIRSYDFRSCHDHGGCYMEGIVDVVDKDNGMLQFIMEHAVWQGEAYDSRKGERIYTPLPGALLMSEMSEWPGRIIKV